MEQETAAVPEGLAEKVLERGLAAIVERAQAGGEITAADMRLAYAASVRLGRPSPTGMPLQHEPRTQRWCTAQEAASELGLTDRWVRDWIHGRASCTPKVPSRLVRGKPQVQPAVLYDHVVRHARRKPPGLRPPQGYADGATLPPAVPADPLAAWLPPDPDEALRLLWQDPEMRRQFTTEERRGIEAWAAHNLRRRGFEARQAATIEPEEAAKMLRGLLDWFVAYVEDIWARELARRILRGVREKMNVDLVKANTAAEAIVDGEIREGANALLAAWRVQVEQQVQGVRALEGTV